MQQATQSLKDAQLDFQIAGMFWDQGGAEARDASGFWAQSHEANLTEFIASVREDFAMDTQMPFVIGRVHAYLPDDYGLLSVVRQAQENVANADPRATMINTDDISRRPFDPIHTGNHWHYDTTGQLEFGRRLASAYLSVYTWSGDADLDGEFSSGDLVSVLAAGEYEDSIIGNSTWRTGDWNGDGEFTSSDLVVALADGGYEQGPRVAVAAVPEPVSFVMLMTSWTVIAIRGRRIGR